MVYIIKKFICIFCFLGPFATFGSLFINKLPAKAEFPCEQCTQHNCGTDLNVAAHCVAWCNLETYKNCWKTSRKNILFSKKMAGDQFHFPRQAPFLELYEKLSARSQEILWDFLESLNIEESTSTTERKREKVETDVLKELQSLHHEAQKEKAAALSAGMQIVP